MEIERFGSICRSQLVQPSSKVSGCLDQKRRLSINPGRWSFGGNRLQIKAEDRLLQDVASSLASVAHVGANSVGVYKSLQSKQDLLQTLIENERSRLRVWLYPLGQERKSIMPGFGTKANYDVSSSATLFGGMLMFVGNCPVREVGMGRERESGTATRESVSVGEGPARCSIVTAQLPGEGDRSRGELGNHAWPKSAIRRIVSIEGVCFHFNCAADLADMGVVSAVLGAGGTGRGAHVLFAGVWQPPVYLAVRHESTGEPPHRRAILPRPSAGTSAAL